METFYKINLQTYLFRLANFLFQSFFISKGKQFLPSVFKSATCRLHFSSRKFHSLKGLTSLSLSWFKVQILRDDALNHFFSIDLFHDTLYLIYLFNFFRTVKHYLKSKYLSEAYCTTALVCSLALADLLPVTVVRSHAELKMQKINLYRNLSQRCQTSSHFGFILFYLFRKLYTGDPVTGPL